jgi:ribose transport system substrate-binding protein
MKGTLNVQPTHTTVDARRYRRWLAVFAVTTTGLLSLAACGSSSSSSSSAVSATDAAAAPSNSGTAAARSALQPFLASPTKITVTTPVKAAPPSGKSEVFLGTSQSQNVEIQQTGAQAAQALGWSFTKVSYDPANPSTFQAALQTAIAKHPNFIGWAGLPISLVSPATMHQINSAGIKLVTQASYPQLLNDTVLANPDSYPNTVQWGKIVGYYFVSDSGGKGVALVDHVPAYSILDGFVQGFKSVVSSMCPKCRVKELDVTLPELAAGQGNSLVVSALRRDPSVNYLVYDDAPFADGVTQALSAAGLSHQVKIIGEGTDPDALAALRAGTESAWTGYSAKYSELEATDAMVRSAEGLPPDAEDNLQGTQLLTKASVGSTTDWNEPSDMLQQFLKLWHK